MMRKLYFFVLLFANFLSVSITAQVILTNGSPSATIDFSNTTSTTVGTNPQTAFAGAGFEPNPTTAGRLNSNAWAVTGWSNGNLAFGGTQTTATTDYTRGSIAIAVTTGGMYAFTGSPASVSNPSLMIQPGGSDFAPGTLTLRIQNNGSSNISQLDLSYNLYVRNDQGRSSSFNFSYSSDDVTYTPIPALDYTSIVAADALGWVLVGTAPSRSTSITGISIAPGNYIYVRWSSNDVAGAGSRDEFGLDDINLTATYAAPNTITTGLVTGVPFTLVDCSATATGAVAFTSTDTYSAGNTFTAQLSNDIGSFASPISIGSISLSGTAPSGSIPITIPAGTPPGVGYLIRVVSSSPTVTGSSSAAFQIIQNGPGGCQSSNTDYYRSVQSGNWNAVSTWESSNDNGTFIPATLTPTSAANSIFISSTHTVNITAPVVLDQVVIRNDAILNHTGGTITIEDGLGHDIDIEMGGVFRLALANTPPVYGAGTPTINVGSFATLRVAAGGMTGAGVGVNANNVVYQALSVLEWAPTTPASFSTGGVTYFPNVVPGIIPIFRCNNPTAMQVGAGTNTVINGIFEAVNANVIWENAGTKTFRNGIRGSGNVIAATVTNPSGMFIINGTTAALGGTGSLTVPNSGLQLGSATGTTVYVSDDKVVTGDISLLSTNTFVELGSSNLTVTGSVSGGTATSYVQTNGTGSLILNNVAGTRNAPIGNGTYNPLTITHADGLNWTLRVEDAVAVADPTFIGNVPKAVQREWHITPSVNPPATGADITFQWDDGGSPSQVGATYNPNENIQVWHEVSQGSPWGDDWLAVGIAQIAGGTPGSVRTASISNWTWFSPFAISNISGPLPVKLISFNVIKINDRNARINWELAACCSRNARFELEKSADGVDFLSIKFVEGSETSRFYEQYDINLGAGITYYRLKAIDVDGKITYSKVVAVINDTKGMVVTAIYPNPATDIATATIASAGRTSVVFTLYSLNGTAMRQWQQAVSEGSSNATINLEGLPAGTYQLVVSDGTSRSVMRLMKQ